MEALVHDSPEFKCFAIPGRVFTLTGVPLEARARFLTHPGPTTIAILPEWRPTGYPTSTAAEPITSPVCELHILQNCADFTFFVNSHFYTIHFTFTSFTSQKSHFTNFTNFYKLVAKVLPDRFQTIVITLWHTGCFISIFYFGYLIFEKIPRSVFVAPRFQSCTQRQVERQTSPSRGKY